MKSTAAFLIALILQPIRQWHVKMLWFLKVIQVLYFTKTRVLLVRHLIKPLSK